MNAKIAYHCWLLRMLKVRWLIIMLKQPPLDYNHESQYLPPYLIIAIPEIDV
jgi:hypothetical protein